MPRPFVRQLCAALVPLSLLLHAGSAWAQGQGPGPSADSAVKPAESRPQKLPAYHHSVFAWEHSLTAATVGVGDTPQSYDPTYTMGFTARTRYYLLDDAPAGRHFSLRLDAGIYREFTNSDQTTRRGQWDLSDTELGGVYALRFRGPSDGDGTIAELRPLTLTMPTSRNSFDSGRYFAPGVAVGVINIAPILPGRVRPDILSLVNFTVGYKRWFARATVPTNESLDRVRLTPDGRTLPGDSLSGSSLVRDQLDFVAGVRFLFGESLAFSIDAAFAPAWKYDVQKDVSLCGVVLTGCTDVQLSQSDTRYLVRTQFDTELSLRLVRGLYLDVGYGNGENQLGLDGRRRGFFYSPSAVFYAALSFLPHEVVAGYQQVAQSRATPNTF